jgi:uncharacterized membrane protein
MGRGYGPGGGFGGHGPMAAGHAHLLGWLIFAALLGLFVVALLYLIRHWRQPDFRRPTPPGYGPRPTDAAFEELRMRFARGELSSEEFAQRMRDLGAPIGPGGPAGPWATPPAGSAALPPRP